MGHATRRAMLLTGCSSLAQRGWGTEPGVHDRSCELSRTDGKQVGSATRTSAQANPDTTSDVSHTRAGQRVACRVGQQTHLLAVSGKKVGLRTHPTRLGCDGPHGGPYPGPQERSCTRICPPPLLEQGRGTSQEITVMHADGAHTDVNGNPTNAM